MLKQPAGSPSLDLTKIAPSLHQAIKSHLRGTIYDGPPLSARVFFELYPTVSDSALLGKYGVLVKEAVREGERWGLFCSILNGTDIAVLLREPRVKSIEA